MDESVCAFVAAPMLADSGAGRRRPGVITP